MAFRDHSNPSQAFMFPSGLLTVNSRPFSVQWKLILKMIILGIQMNGRRWDYLEQLIKP
jgi:hypothetical protein